MNVVDIVSTIISPITTMVDKITTTKEEKIALQNELARIKNEFLSKALNYEAEITKIQSEVVKTEAKGKSWIQRIWRPITMLVFVAIIFNNYILMPYFKALFGWGVELDVPPDLWELIKLGLGGYIFGRSAEKVVKELKGKE